MFQNYFWNSTRDVRSICPISFYTVKLCCFRNLNSWITDILTVFYNIFNQLLVFFIKLIKFLYTKVSVWRFKISYCAVQQKVWQPELLLMGLIGVMLQMIFFHPEWINSVKWHDKHYLWRTNESAFSHALHHVFSKSPNWSSYCIQSSSPALAAQWRLQYPDKAWDHIDICINKNAIVLLTLFRCSVPFWYPNRVRVMCNRI